MRYVSTRGEAAPLDFVEVMLAGLARDGGLYVPEQWPTLDAATIAGFAGRPYAEIACEVMRPFIAGAKGWGEVARFFIEQDAPQRPGAPKVGPLVVHLTNNHLQYAITWFGLAAGLAGVYLVWLRGRLRRA